MANAGIPVAALERLADADAFRSMGFDRRQALWQVSALSDKPTGIYEGQSSATNSEQDVRLPPMSVSEHVLQDYSSTSLSLKAHPLSSVREKLSSCSIGSSRELNGFNNGDKIKVAGLVLVRQRPGTASGICFITIEDETGVINLVVFKKLFDKYRKEILQSRLLMIEGALQREGEVTHVIARRCADMSWLLNDLSKTSSETSSLLTLSRADESDGGDYASKDKRQR